MPDPPPAGPPPGSLPISRREAVVGALGLAAGGVLLRGADVAAGADAPSEGVHPVYRRARFRGLVGRTVDVLDPPGARLRLVRIDDIADGRGGTAFEHESAFSLEFRQVRGPTLPARVLTLAHPGLGPIQLLVTPTGPLATRRYQAVINRLTVI